MLGGAGRRTGEGGKEGPQEGTGPWSGQVSKGKNLEQAKPAGFLSRG